VDSGVGGSSQFVVISSVRWMIRPLFWHQKGNRKRKGSAGGRPVSYDREA
jgi:hypothetical protein